MTLSDGDIFPENAVVSDAKWKVRRVGKVVVFDSGNVALLGNSVNDYLLLPGGGIKEGESAPHGTKRECEEETGCKVHLIHLLGTTDDYRSRITRRCITSGYIGRVLAKGEARLTPDESEIGLHVRWLNLSTAIEILRAQVSLVNENRVSFYNTAFNIRRDHCFLLKAEEYLRSADGPNLL